KKRLGPADRARMDEYLDSVREVERRIEKLAASGTSDVDVTAPMGVPDQFDEQLNVMFEMIALAWQTNMTRIASFMMAREVSMRTYNTIGVPDTFHPLSHHQDDPAKLDRLSRIQTYHTQVFSRFVKRLAEMPDGDGSMLDHSIILFGSNMSNSDLHNN